MLLKKTVKKDTYQDQLLLPGDWLPALKQASTGVGLFPCLKPPCKFAGSQAKLYLKVALKKILYYDC